MALPAHIEAQINAANKGQIAVGRDITQNNYTLHVGSEHGGVVYVVTPENMPQPEPRPGPVEWLPRPFPGLLGREAEVGEAIDALRAGQPVACYGEAGIGKTVLLRHLAHRLDTTSFTDGVVYRSISSQALPDVLQEIFEVFYSTPFRLKPSEPEIRHYLRAKRALLLLDDVDLTREEVDRLMDATPACHFYLASPERRLWGEGHAVALKGLPLDAALALMEHELGRALTPEERPSARMLCAAVEGHPLRLIQMTARASEAGCSLAELARQVQAVSADALTLQNAEDRSEPERRVLALLAVLGGTPVHAGHLAALADLPDAEPILESLAQQGLVQADGLRYRLHENLVDAWPKTEDVSSSLTRALDYFSTWVEQNRSLPDHILKDGATLVEVFNRAIETERWQEALRLGKVLEGVLALGGRWNAWEKVLQGCLRAAEALADQDATAWAKHQLGTRALCMGSTSAALPLLREALRLRKRLGDEIGAALTRHHLDLLTIPPVPSNGSHETPSDLLTRIKDAPLVLKGVAGVLTVLLLAVGGYVIGKKPPVLGPSNLSVRSISSTGARLTWTAANDRQAAFTVERRTGGGAFGEVARVGVNTTEHTDAALSPNTAYSYRVAAISDRGEAVYSEEVQALTLPAEPFDLAVEAVSQTEVVLAWSYPGAPRPGFRIERRGEQEVQFREITPVPTDSTRFMDRGLAANTTYTYRVRATNASGESKYTDPNSATTLLPLPGAPGDLIARSDSSRRVRLSWSDNSDHETGFMIERRSSEDAFSEVARVGANTTEHADAALSPNTAYSYRVAAISDRGEAVYSEEVQALTLPAEPFDLAVEAVSQTEVVLAWSYPGAPRPGFRIERRGEQEVQFREITPVPTDSTRFMDRGLAANTTYTYRVRATNDSGDSGYTDEASDLTRPAIPSNLEARAATPDGITLSWTDNSPRPSRFRMERRSEGGSFEDVADVAPGLTTFTDRGLAANATYHYRVRAVNTSGDSDPSEAVPALTYPAVPSNLSVGTRSQTVLELSWSYAPGPVPAFKIERSTDRGRRFREIVVVSPGTTIYPDEGLAANTTYVYRVRATNDSGDSEYTRPEGGTTLPFPPARPLRLAARAVSSTRIDLAWRDASDNEAGFRVERSTDGGQRFREVIVVPSGTTIYPDEGLAANTTYVYRVRAVNRGGDSDPSNEASATTLPRVRLAGIDLDQARIIGGEPVEGRVVMSGTAPPSGLRVRLASSHPQVAGVPSSVMIQGGGEVEPFVIETDLQGDEPVQVTIVAFYEDAVQEARLTVYPQQRQPFDPGIVLPVVLLPDLAAERIEFTVMGRRTDYRGVVRVRGIVKNVGLGAYASGSGQQILQLYQDGRLVAEQRFTDLAPEEEISVVFERPWDISSPSEGEFPPAYLLVIAYDPDITSDDNPNNDDAEAGNNRTERSGADINRQWRQVPTNQVFR
ncbi:MAG: fibronectin type III domain-containing protein [Rhodothermales bacterium]